MLIISLFSILLMMFSAFMIVKPAAWSKGIIAFSQKPYFHLFEIVSRAITGAFFIYFSSVTNFPTIALTIGAILIMVSVGLLLIGENRHQQFALWSANKFEPFFRLSGIGGLVFGFFLIYYLV